MSESDNKPDLRNVPAWTHDGRMFTLFEDGTTDPPDIGLIHWHDSKGRLHWTGLGDPHGCDHSVNFDYLDAIAAAKSDEEFQRLVDDEFADFFNILNRPPPIL